MTNRTTGARWIPAVLLGRAVRVAARLRKRGGGSAVPGLVVNRVAPAFLGSVLSGFPEGLVVVSGSSGKSTTTKMLVTVLEAHGKRVFTNPSTANISQGLTSALLERADLTGRIDADLAVLEMDEGHGALLSDRFRARSVVLTNVMTDQIDRFHDSEKVVGMLRRIAATATGSLILNADDALVGSVAPEGGDVVVERFGVTEAVLASSPRGLGYAKTSDARHDGGTMVTAVAGRQATIAFDGATHEVGLPARGVHYAVDAAAALAAARDLLGDSFDASVAVSAISAMPAVFGRGEVVTVRGKDVEFVLVQNPASFQLNVDELDEDLDQVLVAMGSDVRDPSYFWPVDSSRIGRARIVSGSKADDIALQLLYQGVDVDEIEPDLTVALDRFLALPDPARGTKTIVFTADSMRRTRSHLGLAQ
ncbi:MurT ligase domain-containing protein [Herbiconiux sp. L3-i23]|uniref:MurT ligase domain-containing protein n=1 Tax=Herbiconiux sp. L3-i23 TaxID=2905871 RepID=UPI002065D30F|nr:MurT ligase domain-containing protein [Herbiconiux sp. L3-i23]BDI22888.1 glutamate ligase [Herbiconiux sp. L3-i23]